MQKDGKLLIIHDLNENEVKFPQNAEVVANNGKIKKCVGCFGCWIKTPGKCVINDGYQDMGAKIGAAEKLVIISRCVFGSYSPFVKNVFDRSISYVLPDFEIRNGEMHHCSRYDNKLKISAYFYGEGLTEFEKQTAEKLVRANAENYNAEVAEVIFVDSVSELEGVIVW